MFVIKLSSRQTLGVLESVSESILSWLSSPVDRYESEILIEGERVMALVHTDLAHQPRDLHKTLSTRLSLISASYRLGARPTESETSQNVLRFHQVENSVLINIKHLQRSSLNTHLQTDSQNLEQLLQVIKFILQNAELILRILAR